MTPSSGEPKTNILQGLKTRSDLRHTSSLWSPYTCVRRKVADSEHCPQQCGLGQDRLRIRKHVCGRVLAAGEMAVEQRLDLGHALADCHIGLLGIR